MIHMMKKNAKIYVANIRDDLSAVDPAGKDEYAARAQAYLARLDAVEGQVRAAVATLPPERRQVVTTHDAFGYFGAAYGLAFIAPLGVSTDSEASAKDSPDRKTWMTCSLPPALTRWTLTAPLCTR